MTTASWSSAIAILTTTLKAANCVDAHLWTVVLHCSTLIQVCQQTCHIVTDYSPIYIENIFVFWCFSMNTRYISSSGILTILFMSGWWNIHDSGIYNKHEHFLFVIES